MNNKAGKILTRHPDPNKQGVNISRQKYDIVSQAIVDAIRAQDPLTFTELIEMVGQDLEGRFEGSIAWYVTTVKLDLEARGTIERVPGSKPQRLRMGSPD